MVIREALREFGADPEAAMRRLLGDEKLFLLLLREFRMIRISGNWTGVSRKGTDPARFTRRTISREEQQC